METKDYINIGVLNITMLSINLANINLVLQIVLTFLSIVYVGYKLVKRMKDD